MKTDVAKNSQHYCERELHHNHITKQVTLLWILSTVSSCLVRIQPWSRYEMTSKKLHENLLHKVEKLKQYWSSRNLGKLFWKNYSQFIVNHHLVYWSILLLTRAVPDFGYGFVCDCTIHSRVMSKQTTEQGHRKTLGARDCIFSVLMRLRNIPPYLFTYLLMIRFDVLFTDGH